MPPDEATGATAPAGAPTAPSSPAPSTPAPTAPEPSSTPAPESPGAEFAGLGTDFDDMVEVEVPAEGGEQPVPPAEPPKPVEEPTPAPPPAAEAKKPEAPPAPAPEGQKEPASAPSEPRGLVEQLAQHRDAIVNELAQSRFALNKEDEKAFTDALDVDATKALVDYVPKFGARVYYEAVTAALNHINQFVPNMIANTMKAMEQHQAVEKQFFTQFPQVQKDKHWNDVVTFANLFKQQNPRMSQADLLAMVGAAVVAKNKLNGAAAQPSQRRPSTPPFVPATAGAGVRVSREPDSPWAGLGEDHED